MKDYNNYHSSRSNKIKSSSERLFYAQFRGCDGFKVVVDDTHEKDVIIQQHTNPMNERLEDKKMIYLDEEDKHINWGSEISGYDNYYKYLIITEPHDNRLYKTCKIRKLTNTMEFEVDGEKYVYSCILNKSPLYTESSYVGDGNVFEDDDMQALIVKYDDITSKIKMFDYVIIGKDYFKVAMVDKIASIRQGETYGVLQIVLIKTIFGSIVVNFKNSVRGILRFARLKERVYNSRARELLTEHNAIQEGDYIEHTYPRVKEDSFGNIIETTEETRRYIVKSMVDMKNTYDTTFVLVTNQSFVIKADDGSLFRVYCGVDDNKTMLKESDVGTSVRDTSSNWYYLQNNEHTRKLGKEITRVLINGNPYKTIGRGNRTSSNYIITIAMTHDVEDSRDDLESGLAYNEYYDESPSTEPPVTDSIKGSNELELKFSDEWAIDNINDETCTWSVDGDFVTIQTFDNHSITLKCQDKTSNRGKIFTLKAEYGNVILIKTIKIV